jgi:DNA-binding transcriptional ArsR family regulator
MATATTQQTTRDWEALARLYIHPLALRVLDALQDSDEPRSPTDLADEFDERLGNVAYHVRALLDRGLIYETHTVPRRGAVQHFYALA